MTSTHELIANITGAAEVAKLEHWEVVRSRGMQQPPQILNLVIADVGVDAGEYRYTVRASDRDRPSLQATGNPGATVEDGLRNVHWHKLD